LNWIKLFGLNGRFIHMNCSEPCLPPTVRFATRDARSHLMHAFSKIQPSHSNMDDIPHNDRIELVIADLETQEYLKYAATARKYKIERTTLSRRHKDIPDSKEDQYSVRTLPDIRLGLFSASTQA
jgi:hypothetical protein